MATGCDPVSFLKQLSRQSSDGLGEEFSFQDELELLQNVYCDEMEVMSRSESSTILSFKVVPSTADKKDEQFVYVEVNITISQKYPNAKPNVTIAKSRGLSDSHLDSILGGVHQLMIERVGVPIIYDLIEYIRDCLTNNNRPYGKCVLCQYEFQDDDGFFRTQCYHYFHSHCIINYLNYCKTVQEEIIDYRRMTKKLVNKKLECPVCRVVLDNESFNNQPVPFNHCSNNALFNPNESLLVWQREMSLLYQRQLDKGGIIRINDHVIDENWVSSRHSPTNITTNEQDTPTLSGKEEDESKTVLKEKQLPQSEDEKKLSESSPKNSHGNGYHRNNEVTNEKKQQKNDYKDCNKPCREYSKDRPRRREYGKDRPRHEYGKDRSRREYGKDRPRPEYGQDRPHREYSKDRPHREYSKDKPPHEYSKDKPPHEYSKDKPHHEYSKDKPPHEYSKDKPHHEYSKDKPPHEYSKDKPPHEYSKDKPPHEYSKDDQKYNEHKRKQVHEVIIVAQHDRRKTRQQQQHHSDDRQQQQQHHSDDRQQQQHRRQQRYRNDKSDCSNTKNEPRTESSYTKNEPIHTKNDTTHHTNNPANVRNEFKNESRNESICVKNESTYHPRNESNNGSTRNVPGTGSQYMPGNQPATPSETS